MLAQAGAFLGVSALVIVTPGQDTALTIRNSLVGGRRGGAAARLGAGIPRPQAGRRGVPALPRRLCAALGVPAGREQRPRPHAAGLAPLAALPGPPEQPR